MNPLLGVLLIIWGACLLTIAAAIILRANADAVQSYIESVITPAPVKRIQQIGATARQAVDDVSTAYTARVKDLLARLKRSDPDDQER